MEVKNAGFLRFLNLYDKSRPENQTKRGEIDSFRTISKVLVYVFCSKRIDFRAILRNTLETPLASPLSVRPRGGKRAEFPRCFPENVDLNFLGFRNPVFSIDTIWKSILEGCLFLLFRSTLVVKIKKTQESTPIILKRIRRT